MDAITFSEARADLKRIMERVVDDRVPIAITRHDGEAVAMVAISEWRAIEETLYLQSSRANAARLASGIEQLDAGRGSERRLLSPSDERL